SRRIQGEGGSCPGGDPGGDRLPEPRRLRGLREGGGEDEAGDAPEEQGRDPGNRRRHRLRRHPGRDLSEGEAEPARQGPQPPPRPDGEGGEDEEGRGGAARGRAEGQGEEEGRRG